jgi:hypothetical protein
MSSKAAREAEGVSSEFKVAAGVQEGRRLEKFSA